jgi:hypothetical protein
MSAHIAFPTWLSLAGVVIALGAALATLRAVYWAHKTVQDAKTNAAADAARHTEQIESLDHVGAAAYNAHQAEMRARRTEAHLDRYVRVLTQLQRVAEVLSDLINAARQERTTPSPRVQLDQYGRGLSSTPVNMLRERLRIEVRLLQALGGPDLSGEIPLEGRDDEIGDLQHFWFDGLAALQELKGVIDTYEASQPSWVLKSLQDLNPVAEEIDGKKWYESTSSPEGDD